MVNIFLILALLVIILTLSITYYRINRSEHFDKTGSDFVGIGDTRYDLRGYKLNRIPVGEYYVRPDRQIKLNGTDGFVWNANLSPTDQGETGCKKTSCPKFPNSYDGYGAAEQSRVYDAKDECWKCDTGCF
jgi:hypothetical protein